MVSPRKSATVVVAVIASACAGAAHAEDPPFPWIEYPKGCVWYDAAHSSVPPTSPSAHVTVVASDETPLTLQHWITTGVWTFEDGKRGGGTEVSTNGAERTMCIDLSLAEVGYWTAGVRASQYGPVLFRTPRPQKFDLSKPIVVIVDPVAGGKH